MSEEQQQVMKVTAGYLLLTSFWWLTTRDRVRKGSKERNVKPLFKRDWKERSMTTQNDDDADDRTRVWMTKQVNASLLLSLELQGGSSLITTYSKRDWLNLSASMETISWIRIPYLILLYHDTELCLTTSVYKVSWEQIVPLVCNNSYYDTKIIVYTS